MLPLPAAATTRCALPCRALPAGGAGPTAEQLASGSGELSWSEEGAVGPVNEYRMDGGLDAAPAPSPAAWGFEAEGAFDMDAPEPLEAEQIMTGETQQQA